jgi:hypothetical protein
MYQQDLSQLKCLPGVLAIIQDDFVVFVKKYLECYPFSIQKLKYDLVL